MKKLIAGPAVQICDECVDICVDIITEDLQEERKSQSERPPAPAVETRHCRLCQQSFPVVDLLLIPNRGLLCDDCFNAVVDLAEETAPEREPAN